MIIHYAPFTPPDPEGAFVSYNSRKHGKSCANATSASAVSADIAKVTCKRCLRLLRGKLVHKFEEAE